MSNKRHPYAINLKKKAYMKRYILFGLVLALISPVATMAQDEDTPKKPQKVLVKKQHNYDTRNVKGRVVNALTKAPVAGVIVKTYGIDGYSQLTGEDGSYELKVPTFASSLSVDAPDYNRAVVGLKGAEQQYDIMLYPTTFQPDYSAETNVRSDQSFQGLQYSSALNVKEDVQKQLGAQAYSIMRSGMPGIGSVMFVQGLNSLNVNAQPLIVVDDVIIEQQYGREMIHGGFYNDILNNINPGDIENVTILRNGTALYGAKGANGVILIQTRRNKSMATRITATLSAGVSLEPKTLSMMGAEQYRGYASELLKSTGTRINEFKFLNEDPNYYYYPQYHNNTDWGNYVYRTAITQNYGINVEGGDNVANYNLSVGYTMAQSTLKYNNMNRLSIRFNTDIKLSTQFITRIDASFANQTRNIRDDGAPKGYDEGTPTSPAFLAYVKSPFLSPYTYGRGVLSSTHIDIDDESYLSEALSRYTNYNWQLANPLALNTYAEAENKNRFENSMFNLSVTPQYRFNANLMLSEHFSYNLVNTSEKYYIPINGVPNYYVASLNSFRENEVRSLASKQNSVMSDTRLKWDNRYGAHDVMLFAGARVLWENYTLNNQWGYNTGSDKTPHMKASLLNRDASGTKDSWTSVAWYAQANYNWLSRYFLQANLTVESSSRFGSEADGLKAFDTVWGIFPGVQASWVVSNEPWLAKVKGIDYLRLSAGFDVSGNDDIDYYAARSYFRAAKFMTEISGLSLSSIGNTEIQWETTKRFNVGLDTRLLNNRLALTFNFFKSRTDNLLTFQSLNFVSGLEQNWSNGGALENTGFDVSANIKVLALKDWQWQVGASLGHYKNEITELADGAKHADYSLYGGTVRSEVGAPANQFYGYKTKGVFATSEDAQQAGLYVLGDNGVTRNYFKAGDMQFVDKDGNHEINAADMDIIGDPNPDFYGNIFTTLAYKRFKLDVRFNYSVGNDVYNYLRAQTEGGNRFMNQSTAMLARWQVEGQQTSIPKVTFQDPMGNARFSDRWIEDGSYLKLKSVTLSYNLPLNSEFIQGLQFWVQGNNLLTFTKYLGTDPEFSMTSKVIGQGIDIGLIGQSRSFVAGIKVNL